jgi:2-keto-4-pentenoate hydratase
VISTERAQAAARRLQDAHTQRERFQPLQGDLSPATADDAYAIQDAFVALRARHLGAIAGYKIALSTPAMRQFVGVDSPQAGVMLASTVRRGPARVRAADYVNLIVEFEIAVALADDLPAADAPFFRDRVARAVGAVMPALELADDRNADYTRLPRHPFDLIADNAWNEGAVLGEPLKSWLGAVDLAQVVGVASINGKAVGEGRGSEAMGHPFDAVAWLADNLAARGRSLVRGQVVITGSLVTTKRVKAGDRVKFSVSGLGTVQLAVD